VRQPTRQQVGLIGWPVDHSVSPAMHNAAFQALGLDWEYSLLPTEPGQVEAAVDRLRRERYRGANVTVPHKQAIMACMDRVSAAAQAIGAANTVVVQGDRLLGDNTDANGFELALGRSGFKAAGRRAVVLGAGGAARAVVYGLLDAGIAQVTVLGRAPQHAEELALDVGSLRDWPSRLCGLPLTAGTLVKMADSADLLVNATPVGMWPQAGGSLWPDDRPIPPRLAVFDLVYNPATTRLLGQARASGARAIGGLEMLVQQGALAFELWTGQAPPVKVMRSAAKQAIRRWR
jgi:shikimate dehydrogenase